MGRVRQNTSAVGAADKCPRCIQLRSCALLFPLSRVLLRDRSVCSTMLREHIDALRQHLPSPCDATTSTSAVGARKNLRSA